MIRRSLIAALVLTGLLQGGAWGAPDPASTATPAPTATQTPTLNDPKRIIELMEHSTLSYTISLEGPTEAALRAVAEARSRRMDPFAYLAVAADGTRLLKVYEPSKAVMDLAGTANDAFEAGDYAQAETLYRQALALDPTFWKLNISIGDALYGRAQYRQAADCYRTALAANPADAQAARFLGDTLWRLNDTAGAEAALITAVILDRNYPEAWKQLAALIEPSGRSVYQIAFNRDYQISRGGGNIVNIRVTSAATTRWLPYALCKAMWAYEPGYRESKQGQDSPLDEERECVFNMLAGYEVLSGGEKDFKPDPYLERVKRIVQDGYIDVFLLFEVLGPELPEILAALPPESQAVLADYIKKYVLVPTSAPASPTHAPAPRV